MRRATIRMPLMTVIGVIVCLFAFWHATSSLAVVVKPLNRSADEHLRFRDAMWRRAEPVPQPTTESTIADGMIRAQSAVVTLRNVTSHEDCATQCRLLKVAHLCKGFLWSMGRGCVVIGDNAVIQLQSIAEQPAENNETLLANETQEDKNYDGFDHIRDRDSAPGEEFDALVITGAPLQHCLDVCQTMNGTSSALEVNSNMTELNHPYPSINATLLETRIQYWRNINQSVVWLKTAAVPRRRDLCIHVVWQPATRTCYLKSDEVRTLVLTGTHVYARMNLPSSTVGPLASTVGSSLSLASVQKLFLMLAGHQYLDKRLKAALQTWLCDQSVVAFIEPDVKAVVWNFFRLSAEDRRPDDRFTPVMANPYCPSTGRVMVVWVTTNETEKQSPNGAWKNLVILDALRSWLVLPPEWRSPEWYVMVDDDTFMFPDNLDYALRATRLRRPASEPIYTGCFFNDAVLTTTALPTGKQATVAFAQGGAGIILDVAAVRALQRNLELCIQECTQWAGDIRLGCCAVLSGVSISDQPGFWWRTPFLALGTDQRSRRYPYPVSFHRMRVPDWTRDLWQVVLDRRTRSAQLTLTNSSARLRALVTWDDVGENLRRGNRYPEYLFDLELHKRLWRMRSPLLFK